MIEQSAASKAFEDAQYREAFGCDPTDWHCEKCGVDITEDEHRVWGTCEACERAWCDDVDQANAFDRSMVDGDKCLELLISARHAINEAWIANMEAADYVWNSKLSREINAAYDTVSVLISERINGRKAHQ